MDGDAVTAEPSEPKTLTQIFREVFPYYLAMGMTYNEFWYGNPSLVRDYRKARDIKLHEDEWARHRLGAYIFDALMCVAPVMRASFSKGKVEPGKYPEEPWPLTEKEAEERNERDRRIAYQRMKEKLFSEARRNRERQEEAKKEAIENEQHDRQSVD